MWTVVLSPGDYQIRKTQDGQGIKEQQRERHGGARRPDERRRAFYDSSQSEDSDRVRARPTMPSDLHDSDIVDQALKDHPGLTSQKAEEMIEAYGF
jgi:hypothetical protein